MVDLAGAHLVDLDVMSPDEALTLFTKIVGEERVAAERKAALDVVAACGFLPLAIRIAASRLAARRTWTVSVLAAKLADERRRLDELQAGDLAVKATFELGYGQLEPAQARAFRLLGLADGPDISLAAAAAVLDLPPEDAEDLLESLVDTSLLESAAPGRYRFHDLVRLYARACAERDEQPPGERDAAMSRLLDFYLATAAGVYAIERPGDRLIDHLEHDRVPGLGVPRPRSARWTGCHAEADCCSPASSSPRGRTPCARPSTCCWAAIDLAESGADSRSTRRPRGRTGRGRGAEDPRAEAGRASPWPIVHHVSGPFRRGRARRPSAPISARAADDPSPRCRAPNQRGVIALYQGRHADGEAHLRRPSRPSAPTATAPARPAPCATCPAPPRHGPHRQRRRSRPAGHRRSTTRWA